MYTVKKITNIPKHYDLHSRNKKSIYKKSLDEFHLGSFSGNLLFLNKISHKCKIFIKHLI